MLINGSFSGCWALICSYAVVHPSLNYSLGFLIQVYYKRAQNPLPILKAPRNMYVKFNYWGRPGARVLGSGVSYLNAFLGPVPGKNHLYFVLPGYFKFQTISSGYTNRYMGMRLAKKLRLAAYSRNLNRESHMPEIQVRQSTA